MKELTKEALIEAVSKGIQSKDLSQQAVGVLKRSTERVLERIRQNVDAQIKEDSYPVIEEFTRNIANKLSAMSQQWVDGVSNDLVVFPEGTRYIFRDGACTTVVVEQQPQNRHINYNGKVYLLAMPFVQFIIPFRNHVPTGHLFVGMTKKPITDLDQMIFNPIVPNIREHQVCMGNFKFPQNGTMTEKVEKIISGFWQSEFNDSGSNYMMPFIKENNLSLDVWSQHSRKDSTFILEKKIKFSAGRTIRKFLAVDSSGKGSTTSLVSNLKTEILNAVGSIGGDLQRMMTNVDVRTENRDKVHIEVLSEILKEILVQAHAELWEFMQIQLQQERQRLQTEMEAAATKLKKDFRFYMESNGNTKRGYYE